MISGVHVQDMWNAQAKVQVTAMHRLNVNSHCDAALFISVYDITMDKHSEHFITIAYQQ